MSNKTHKLNFSVTPEAEARMQRIMHLTRRQRSDMIDEATAFYLYVMTNHSPEYFRLRSGLLKNEQG